MCKTGPTFYSILNIQLCKYTGVEQITSRFMNTFRQQLSIVGAAPPTSLHSIKWRVIWLFEQLPVVQFQCYIDIYRLKIIRQITTSSFTPWLTAFITWNYTKVFSVLIKYFVQAWGYWYFYWDFKSVTFTEVKSQLQFQALQNAFCLKKRKRKHEDFPKRLKCKHFTLCRR